MSTWTKEREAEAVHYLKTDWHEITKGRWSVRDLPDAIAEIRRLRGLIERAPHAEWCNNAPEAVLKAGLHAYWQWRDEHSADCGCWKRKAMPPSTT